MLNLCIPTILRYDLCCRLIESAEKNTIKPDQYIIIDNGLGFLDSYNLNISNIQIFSFDYSLSVSGSWNWFIKNISGDLLISNDDIVLYENSIETFLNAKEDNLEDDIVIFSPPYPNNYSLFLTDSSIQEKVGLFDENFYPAYFEDNDYTYRMSFTRYKTKIISVSFRHDTSSTLKRKKELGIEEEHHEQFRKNQEYYIKKWGGLPFSEKYKTPFNR